MSIVNRRNSCLIELSLVVCSILLEPSAELEVVLLLNDHSHSFVVVGHAGRDRQTDWMVSTQATNRSSRDVWQSSATGSLSSVSTSGDFCLTICHTSWWRSSCLLHLSCSSSSPPCGPEPISRVCVQTFHVRMRHSAGGGGLPVDLQASSSS